MCAALLGLDGLGSTGELVMGQAGLLVHALRQIPSPADLSAVLAAKMQPADRAEGRAAARASVSDLLRAMAAALAGIPGGNGAITG